MPLRASEAARLLSVYDLLAEAERSVPGWAGANDDAHAWWARVQKVLAEVAS